MSKGLKGKKISESNVILVVHPQIYYKWDITVTKENLEVLRT